MSCDAARHSHRNKRGVSVLGGARSVHMIDDLNAGQHTDRISPVLISGPITRHESGHARKSGGTTGALRGYMRAPRRASTLHQDSDA